MKTVRVDLGSRGYNIYIGKGLIAKLPSLVTTPVPDVPIFVITNRKVKSLHGGKLKKVLKHISKKILFYEIPDSEKAKSFPVYIKTIRALTRFARKTKPLVFAFGGGVVGDLAGFVASAYRRGVPYIQIPTTLLGQVDSAIGGKVAIDVKEAKNIVGNFYQPKMVLCDLDLLKTLPEKELRNGLVEIVKYGIIKDRGLFLFLEKSIGEILRRDTKALLHVISKSCSIKAAVVEKDELDTKDVRAMLNFGHTIGHAIETASRYSKLVTHGRAVAAGMVAAGLIAVNLKMFTQKDFKKICSLIEKVAPRMKIKGITPKSILKALSYDKKFIYGGNRFILPKQIGLVKIVERVPEAIVKAAVKEFLAERKSGGKT